MSTFRKQFTVLGEDTGAYVDGIWMPGLRLVSLIQASVQPLAMGKDMDALPDGRHMSDFVKIYTSTKLRTTADGEGAQPDIIVFDGYCFEILSIDKNQSNVISHYKYTASKAFKFTSDAEWQSGALVRP
ncbi:MAG: hypothetical protein ACRC0J_18150 [Shewanella oncorhynchi]